MSTDDVYIQSRYYIIWNCFTERQLKRTYQVGESNEKVSMYRLWLDL